MAHDAITFLVDLGVYRPALQEFLTDPEKEQLLRYQPVISRQRYAVSRSILKHILAEILQQNTLDVILARNQDRRIQVRDHPHLFVSLSYTGTWIAISVGKQKIGSDIEGVHPVRHKKISASPLFAAYSSTGDLEHVRNVILVWTLVESYAKLYDRNPYPLLNRCSPFRDADFMSYDIEGRAIFSLASAGGSQDEVLVWLDVFGQQ